jgi:hypothetical protein
VIPGSGRRAEILEPAIDGGRPECHSIGRGTMGNGGSKEWQL